MSDIDYLCECSDECEYECQYTCLCKCIYLYPKNRLLYELLTKGYMLLTARQVYDGDYYHRDKPEFYYNINHNSPEGYKITPGYHTRDILMNVCEIYSERLMASSIWMLMLSKYIPNLSAETIMMINRVILHDGYHSEVKYDAELKTRVFKFGYSIGYSIGYQSDFRKYGSLFGDTVKSCENYERSDIPKNIFDLIAPYKANNNVSYQMAIDCIPSLFCILKMLKYVREKRNWKRLIKCITVIDNLQTGKYILNNITDAMDGYCGEYHGDSSIETWDREFSK